MMTALLFAACTPAADFIATLPKHEGIACKYEQKKRSPLFRKELKSEGQLWVRGQKLRFDTASSSLTVNGSDVTLKSGSKVDKLPLSAAPKVEAFLGTFSGLFVGKLDTLEKSFETTTACDGNKTALLLTPKGEAPVRKMVLTFDGTRLVRVELVEPTGDEVSLGLTGCRFGIDAASDALF